MAERVDRLRRDPAAPRGLLRRGFATEAGRARGTAPALEVRGLNVFYGRSHALQGVDLSLERGVLSVVGRNGMGKTTLCKAIMGMVPVASGAVAVHGASVVGRPPAETARMGVGYVPQGRRLWRSLTVDEHLRMLERSGGAWTRERVYATFPRLAERRTNGGGQLSGGEQQMLAIGRALLQNPRLLVMDEPTEGLAPVIVDQVEAMLRRLGEEGDVDVLVIEQNIGVACAVSERVAIMVNGRVTQVMDAARLSGDRDLQQALLGVGRHAHDETDGGAAPAPEPEARHEASPARVWVSNPKLPTRWSRPAPVRVIEGAARTVTPQEAARGEPDLRPLARRSESVALVVGTLDTKGEELRFLRERLAAAGVRARLVDLSTSGKPSGADVPPHEVAAAHPRGASGVFTGDRGTAVAAMTEAFRRWMARQHDVAGAVAAGGSGNTAMVAPGFRTLPLGVPKLVVSTVASGDVSAYVGPSDMAMMHSVADVQGLNSITRDVLANAAGALAGMIHARAEMRRAPPPPGKPAVGLTMFGLTTPCVQRVVAGLPDHDCLVFHATGTGGRSMEALLEEGRLAGVIDVTTTEVADMMMGGVFAADEDRLGAVIRTGLPYVGSTGALDMVNFGPPGTVPDRHCGRLFYEHNPQVTLMRTTPEECARMGAWIGERLNRMGGPVRFLMPEGGVSGLDAPGAAFHDPAARAALHDAIERTVRPTGDRRVERLPHHVNDPAFADALLGVFREIHGRAERRAS